MARTSALEDILLGRMLLWALTGLLPHLAEQRSLWSLKLCLGAHHSQLPQYTRVARWEFSAKCSTGCFGDSPFHAQGELLVPRCLTRGFPLLLFSPFPCLILPWMYFPLPTGSSDHGQRLLGKATCAFLFFLSAWGGGESLQRAKSALVCSTQMLTFVTQMFGRGTLASRPPVGPPQP